MNAFVQTLRNLGPARLVAMGAVTIGLIAFFAFVTSRLTTPNLALLYSDLSVDDSSAIVQRLESTGVPYELRGDGTQIYVPGDQVLRLRMNMAGEGLPSGGSVGYEIFDGGEGIGSTRYMNQLNHVRAIEGELSRTIAALARVRAARVHLVMPRRELFSRESHEPSASIVLKLQGALGPGQVLAIQHLVATAVPQLAPSRISIVDDKGNLLAKGGDEEGGFAGGGAEEMRRQYEARLEREIEQLLERSVGVGKVRAEVAAEIDFDRITRQAERYDPDGQVVRSTVIEEEQADSSEAGAEDTVSVAGNLPDEQAFTEGGGGTQSASRSTLTRETTNYEITKVLETQVRETGVVRRLSVAVLVDGAADADGNYVERDAAEIEQLTALVRSAVGYEENRGDTVQVVNLQFAAVQTDFSDDAPASFFGFSKNDLFRIAEMVVLGIVAILVILLVVRPLISRAFDAIPAGGAAAAAAGGGGGAAMLTGPGGQPVDPGSDQRSLADALGQAADGQAAVEKVEGHVQASSLKQITEIVERHPEETVSILRGWMYQDN